MLKQDVANKVHHGMTRTQFHQSRPEYYQNYPKDVIARHVRQEVKLQKFLKQYSNRRKGRGAPPPAPTA